VTFYKEIDKEKRKYERKYQRECRRMLMMQIQPVLDYLESTGDMQNPDMAANKLNFDRTNDFYTSLYSDVGQHFSAMTYNEIIKRKDVSETVKDSWLNQILHYMRFTAGYRITSINKTSRKRAVELIRRALVQAEEAGLGLIETRNSIVKYVGETWRNDARYRAERIARTEVLTASNRASYIGAQATGLKLKKKWIASTDDRTRTSHLEVDPTPIEMDEQFVVGRSLMMIPGDASADPAEVINCRCVVRYITDL
jgi:uncharacterized protein with gpF-like domain